MSQTAAAVNVVNDVIWIFSAEARNFGTLAAMVVAGVAAAVAAWNVSVAARAFAKSVRDKNTEFAIKIEENYVKHMETLLACEYVPDYNRLFLPALVKSVLAAQRQDLGDAVQSSDVEAFTDAESAAINRLESMLRHFHFVVAAERANPTLVSFGENHDYYLRLMMHEDNVRPDLRDYIQRHWKSVFAAGISRLASDPGASCEGAGKCDPLKVHEEVIRARAQQISAERRERGEPDDPIGNWRAAERDLRREIAELRARTEPHRKLHRQHIADVRAGIRRVYRAQSAVANAAVVRS